VAVWYAVAGLVIPAAISAALKLKEKSVPNVFLKNQSMEFFSQFLNFKERMKK
jgi:hypothetical protein